MVSTAGALGAAEPDAPTLWKLEQLESLGGQPTTILGEPRLIDAPGGKAVAFDGRDDALFVDMNPLAGLRQFTVEVVFRPDAGGPKEQRFLHFQERDSESRLLFETRLTDDGRWFLDTYLKTAKVNSTLFAEKSPHAIGPWYHAAVVVDGKSMRHYVNGTEELQADIDFEPLAAGQTSLGVRANKLFWYQGAIRQVRITPRVLSSHDFQDLKSE
jgi:hypothetical protein